jgi:hypothetical protein
VEVALQPSKTLNFPKRSLEDHWIVSETRWIAALYEQTLQDPVSTAVNPNFQFTAKLFQGFTHIPRGAKSSSPFQLTVSSKDEGLPREGLDSIASEGRLGAVLVQFPVSFKC